MPDVIRIDLRVDTCEVAVGDAEAAQVTGQREDGDFQAVITDTVTSIDSMLRTAVERGVKGFSMIFVAYSPEEIAEATASLTKSDTPA